MTTTEDSPFSSCKFDDQPLPPLQEDNAPDGVASMIDSPFASGLINPGLVEQLSHSVATGSKPTQASSGPVPAEGHAACAAAAAAGRSGSDAVAADVDVSNAAKASGGRLQGVASILESPFASTCLDQEIKQLDLQQGSSKVQGAA